MIVLGGVVRLTGSGLSITVWEPIVGTVPPLSHEAWERAFALYRASPEFRHVHPNMDLPGFQRIFWPEYLHRLLGRALGVLVAAPTAWFAYVGWLDRRLVRGLVILFALGGLQGVVGWLMVRSGLVDAPRVSHLRLTVHLGMGLLLFGFASRLAVVQTFGGSADGGGFRGLRAASRSFVGLVAVTALSGGLVAGLRAGHAFPTFPLMLGQLVPDGLGALTPVWRNLHENLLTVMFEHRVLAVTVPLFAVVLAYAARKQAVPRPARIGFDLIVGFATVQVGLGIATVLLHVPVAIAALHQGNAALLLAAALYASYALRRFGPA
jgi:cytochrome c oxidase assembly protein subunit 15